MTEKEIKKYLLSQVKEKGHIIIKFDYDKEYNMLYVITAKKDTCIIWYEKYEVDSEYNVHFKDSALAEFNFQY